MSTREVAAETLDALDATEQQLEAYANRGLNLGALTISRARPSTASV